MNAKGGNGRPTAEAFVARIRETIAAGMHAAAMTSAEVAARTGISAGRVHRYLTAKGDLAITELGRIATTLGMDSAPARRRNGETSAEPKPQRCATRVIVANDIDIRPGTATSEAVRDEIRRVLGTRGHGAAGDRITVIDNPGANPANGLWAAIDSNEQQSASGTWTLRAHYLLTQPNLQILIETPAER